MRRREFITLLGGAAATWPIAARSQQRVQMRRIGVLVSGLAADDPEWRARGTAFVQGLQERGWTDGRNVRIDTRFGLADTERLRRSAAELVALAPDVILAGGTTAVGVLQQATRTLPIVFANAVDPIGLGMVASLTRPGGNTTGFMSVEFGLSAKWVELLKQIAPHVTRAAVVRNPRSLLLSQFAAIQAVAPSFGMEVTPVDSRDADELEHGLAAFARGSNDGLIVTGQGGQILRDLIIALAARHRMPAVYPFRSYVTAGGLTSYGVDQAEPYRQAAGYVDRILKGAKPGDLPVQAPTKYETILNMKTAKALGLDVPASVYARADEVIE
jgi:putative tryptophan/tyrosine transport system substrate-binding protein